MMKLSLRWGTVPVVWHCHGGMALSRWYGTGPVVWHCPGGMALCRYYYAVPVVWHCPGGMALCRYYYAVIEVRQRPGVITQSQRFGTVSEIWQCSQRFCPVNGMSLNYGGTSYEMVPEVSTYGTVWEAGVCYYPGGIAQCRSLQKAAWNVDSRIVRSTVD